SGGQKKRVAIAKALIQPANLLILDEPTNHLDNETVEWLEKFLASYKGALMLVTHDRYFLNRVTNYIYELDKGNLYIYEGNYEVFVEKKAEREELEASAEVKDQNTLRRELARLKRGARARSTKQKARVERVHDMQEKKFDTQKQDVNFQVGSTRLGKQVIELKGRTKEKGCVESVHDMKEKKFDTKKQNVNLQVGSTRLGKKVIELKGIRKAFAGKKVISDFDYLITPGDRLGIIGPNGSGKTTLLNMMAKRVSPDAGEVSVGETVKIGYYTQGDEELDGTMRVIDYIKEVAEVVYTKDGDPITAEQMLEHFLFSRSEQWTYIRRLSGGEKRRLY